MVLLVAAEHVQASRINEFLWKRVKKVKGQLNVRLIFCWRRFCPPACGY